MFLEDQAIQEIAIHVTWYQGGMISEKKLVVQTLVVRDDK